MRNRCFGGLMVLLLSLLVAGCGNNEGRGDEKSVEKMTAQSLGLAYLEEFKLEDAEKEFLKFIRLAPKEKLGYANLGLTYLRMGKYPEAEKQLLKAIKIDASDADIRLILATVYQMNDQRDKAISELREALEFAPGHIKSLYDLSELYAAGSDASSRAEYKTCLLKLAETAPGNLVPLLNLTDIYIRDGELDNARGLLEKIEKQYPEFPKEAMEYFTGAMSLLTKNDKDNALIQFTIFHNYLKVTSPYQAGMMDLKGPGGSLIGFPLITFDQKSASGTGDNKSLLEVIKFTDVTATTGLEIIPGNGTFNHAEAADYDGDDDIDLFVGSYDPSASAYKHFLFNNEMGRFRDVSSEAGIDHAGKETAASFADFDNDGFLDLFILKEDGDILYRNADKGLFKDVTKNTGIGTLKGGNSSLFLDFDHDGDLDMFETTSVADLMFRNNGDGTFQEQAAKMKMTAEGAGSRDAVFGDFDDDGDIDLFVVNEKSGNILFSNQRQGVFRDITAESGLKSNGGSYAAAAADYNNDGFTDLFVVSGNAGDHMLYRNKGNGTFEPEGNCAGMLGTLEKIKGYDAAFPDFDNDGLADICFAGEPMDNQGRGFFLFHNDGNGSFSDVSGLLPQKPLTAREITLFDYNSDGDMDLLVSGLNTGVSLLRNDGGNLNHYVGMKLVGLRAGSSKNNHFGIGAKVEIRSGDLYQSMIVTDPNVHFGLGNRLRADVIRITWTNGVPQNIFMPGADQALIEAQTLKGSCPFLYTWNGEEYVFTKDIMWRSALGMPLGIMGGTTKYGFPEASDDYIKIPGELLKEKDGKYSMQVTSELWEAIYTDQLELVVLDHPDTTDVYVPEQFSPPPFPGMKILYAGSKQLPVTAVDGEGNDVKALIAAKDDRYIAGFRPDRYQGVTAIHDLYLDPGNTGKSGPLYLFLNGWIFPTDASINAAIAQSKAISVMAPVIQVLNGKGEWVTVVDNLGFPMGKDKTVIADLSGKFLTSDHRVRIRTNMEIYWDHIFFSDNISPAAPEIAVLKPVSADLHYRGFSEGYRKGGPYGPHWFDYSRVDKNRKWRDMTGNYTRYGDVLPLLQEPDNKYVITNTGDEITIEFDATAMSQPGKGRRRDFLIHSVGWVKDADMNTALGNTVEPLPFHGMTSYPPSDKDNYPDNKELREYNRQYNTRVVTGDDFRNALKQKKDR